MVLVFSMRMEKLAVPSLMFRNNYPHLRANSKQRDMSVRIKLESTKCANSHYHQSLCDSTISTQASEDSRLALMVERR